MKYLFATTALAAALAFAPAQAQTAGTITAPDGYVASDAVLSTDTLEGVAVYDGNNDEIGKVHDLIFTNDTDTLGGMAIDPPADGTAVEMDSPGISDAVIDVGGFLGIGVHRVAVPIDALEVYTNADGDDLRVYLPWTKEQLKDMPEFDESEAGVVGQ